MTYAIFFMIFFAVVIGISWKNTSKCPECGGRMEDIAGWDKRECVSCHHIERNR